MKSGNFPVDFCYLLVKILQDAVLSVLLEQKEAKMSKLGGYVLFVVLLVTGCDILETGPSTPLKPWGDATLKVNQKGVFYTVSQAENSDSQNIRFDFGDGTYSDWSHLVAPGETVSVMHSWSSSGVYYVRAQAMDANNTVSRWSEGFRVTVSDSVQSSDSFSLQVVGSFELGNNAFTTRLSKKGSYVFLAGHKGGLYIIDVSNPQTPVEIKRYVPQDSLRVPYVNDVKIVGNYAYIAVTYYYSSLTEVEVLNISDPSSPVLVGAYQDTSGHSYFEYLYVVDTLVYVLGQYPHLVIINFKNPAHPVRAGDVQISGYYHYDIFVSGDYAYVSCNEYGAQIIDVHDPTNPNVLNTLTPSGNVSGVFVKLNRLYTASTGGYLTIYDIQDPAHPSQLSSIGFGDNANGVLVQGNYAYVADHTAGLYVVDVSNPELPVVKGGVDTPGNAWSVVVDGNFAYVADGTSLQIVRLR